jgi:hypothetical protein
MAYDPDYLPLFHLRMAAGGCRCDYHLQRVAALRTGLAIARFMRMR